MPNIEITKEVIYEKNDKDTVLVRNLSNSGFEFFFDEEDKSNNKKYQTIVKFKKK